MLQRSRKPRAAAGRGVTAGTGDGNSSAEQRQSMNAQETVVVIDDDREIRTLIEIALAWPGRRVVGFSDGNEALAFLARDESVDLVVSDVAMEGYDAHRLLRHLRTAERTAAVPVIFVSASDQADDGIGGPGVSTVSYLRKPFEISELRERVAEAMRRRGDDFVACDPLTGLFLRGPFERALGLALEAASKAGTALALVVGNVDDFSSRGARVGPGEDDGILQGVAKNFTAKLRATDLAARIGNYVFASLHPACDAAGAEAIARRISQAISGDPRCTGVRISLGAAVAADPKNIDAASLLRAADEAVHAAKESGGDGTAIRTV
jgi:diguanylate cyclase (GGDEF)-like protein